MKRADTGPAGPKQPKRLAATLRSGPRSPKAAEIIALVEALTTGVDGRDGASLGRKICRLLADAYAGRGRPSPRWVEQLITYYTGKRRVS